MLTNIEGAHQMHSPPSLLVQLVKSTTYTEKTLFEPQRNHQRQNIYSVRL